MKKDNRENITTIIHSIKESYSKIFREKFPMNEPKMEKVLNEAARQAKKGYDVIWFRDSNGEKQIDFKFRPSYFRSRS